MSSIKNLIEQAVLTDFKKDGLIASQFFHGHEYNLAKAGDDGLANERALVMTVTATDLGEFYHGSGIRRVGVSIEIVVNVGADLNPPDLLDFLAEKISDRLPVTQESRLSRHAAFSNEKLKVFGITDETSDINTELDLERARVISRIFIAAQLDPNISVPPIESPVIPVYQIIREAELVNEINAAEDLPQFAVVSSNGLISDSANPVIHYGRVMGLNIAPAPQGTIASIAVDGEISNLLWNWSTGAKLFLNGTVLSPVAPSIGFSQLIAIARTPQTIILMLGQPILLT